MTATDDYLLGRSDTETGRLARQIEDLADESSAFLDRVGLAPGARAIDIACGPHGILDQLAERVGPAGRVTGLEKDPHYAAMAREFAAREGLANVEIVHGDARACGLPGDAFDLVHARLVLVNVPRPEEIVREMARLARPGGVVASHEADYQLHVCDPPHPAWDRLSAIYHEYARRRGVDLFIARRTARLLREAGLADVRIQPLVHAYPPGHNRRTVFCDFLGNVRDGLVDSGLVSAAEFDDQLRALRAHVADPDTLMISHLFVQAWGRKP